MKKQMINNKQKPKRTSPITNQTCPNTCNEHQFTSNFTFWVIFRVLKRSRALTSFRSSSNGLLAVGLIKLDWQFRLQTKCYLLKRRLSNAHWTLFIHLPKKVFGIRFMNPTRVQILCLLFMILCEMLE